MEGNQSNENSHAAMKWQSGCEIENGWMRWAVMGIHFALSKAIKQQCQHNDRDPGMFLFSFFHSGRLGKLSKVRTNAQEKFPRGKILLWGSGSSEKSTSDGRSLFLSSPRTHSSTAGERERDAAAAFFITKFLPAKWKTEKLGSPSFRSRSCLHKY